MVKNNLGARGDLKLFANRSGEGFANRLVSHISANPLINPGFRLSPLETLDFANSEIRPEAQESVRGSDVYLVQNCFDPTSKRSIQDNLFESLATVNALRHAGAAYVNLIIPEFPYARQEKPSGRQPITAKMVADFISTAGATNVLTADLHADQISGFFDPTVTKIDNLRASKVFLPEIRSLFSKDRLEDMVVMGPDAGGTPRAQYYAKQLCANTALAFKKRSYAKANHVEELNVVGDFEGKDILIIDDMIDTVGTIKAVVEKLRDEKAKDIYVMATHPLFNNPAT
ncbi:MAG: ribose-phosphate diphosphokinase [Candidatus Woesearchaeota archaeon]|jgi:ribose-phosphate pyrophosphokinase|nr:ribose-phosphate diphosphokinase [Candidatus Woesearchaeota archaeon]